MIMVEEITFGGIFKEVNFREFPSLKSLKQYHQETEVIIVRIDFFFAATRT